MLGGGNTYVEGSILRHCIVQFGGYLQQEASIHFDRISVALDQVSIVGMPSSSRYVHGVYFSNPTSPVLLSGVSIEGSSNYGIYVSYIQSTITLVNTMVQGCRRYGLYISNSQGTSILRSKFDGNGLGVTSHLSRQVYASGGKYDFDIFHFTFEFFSPVPSCCIVTVKRNRGLQCHFLLDFQQWGSRFIP